MLLVSYWLAAATLSCLSLVSSKNIHEYQLRGKLFTNYTKHVSPQPINRPVNVSFNIAFASLKSMDVKKEEISINLWQRQYWYDKRLTWAPAENGNITQLGVLLKEIWTPNIYLYYSSGTVNKFGKDMTGSLPFSATLNNKGHLFFTQPTTIYAPCEVDVGYYPFDDQICQLTFGTWSQDVSVVRMLLYKGGFDMTNYLKHNEWEIVSVKPSIQSLTTHDHNLRYMAVVYTIHLRRHALFYMINYILPSIVIAILSLLVFLIPPEVGKRMEAGINLLLCLSVYLMLVNSKMPLSSKSFPLLTKFYGCTIMILVVSLCCSCWVYSYHFMNPSGWDIYHLPAFLEKIIFKYLGPALRLPCKSICHENQAFEEDQTDNGMQGTSEKGTDRSQRETIFNQRSSSLVDEGVLLKAAGSRTSDQTKRSEMFKYQKTSCQLVDRFILVQFQEDIESKSEIISNQGRSSLPDGGDPIDDEDDGVVLREEGKPATVARDSSQVETMESNWSDDVVSADIRGKEIDFGKEEKCTTIEDDRELCHHDQEEDIELDSSKTKKKKKKKKKKASKLIHKTIAAKRIAERFEQHIREMPGDSANQQVESSDAQDDGDDSSDHRSQNTNLKVESSDAQDDSDDSSDHRSQNTNLQEESFDAQYDGDGSCDHRSQNTNLQEESPTKKNNGEKNYDINVILYNNKHQEREQEHVSEPSVSEAVTSTTLLPSDSYRVPTNNPNHHLLYLAQSSQQQNQKFENTERWKLAAMILDRLFIILLVISIVVSFLASFLSSPRVRKGLI